jgi:hypothetical protein
MQSNSENTSGFGNRLASYLAVERKKAMVAGCLVLVMSFMWIKLLTGKGEPAMAAAAIDNGQVTAVAPAAESVVSYKQPPIVAGRNDTVVRDYFSPGDWQAFLTKSSSEQSEVTGEHAGIIDDDIRGKTIRRIADGLKLQIMEIGTEPQAFVSDTLVKVGSRLTIAAGETAYEFKVLGVSRKSVQLECEGKVFDVKLKEQ